MLSHITKLYPHKFEIYRIKNTKERKQGDIQHVSLAFYQINRQHNQSKNDSYPYFNHFGLLFLKLSTQHVRSANCMLNIQHVTDTLSTIPTEPSA